MLPPDPPAAVREDCARVVAQARAVRIRADHLADYASRIDAAAVASAQAEAFAVPDLGHRTEGSAPSSAARDDRRSHGALGEAETEARCAYVLALDAINFGSGFFPALHKRQGVSGYRTIEAALRAWVARDGPPSAGALAGATPSACAKLFGQALEPPIDTLMNWFARAWRELGRHVLEKYGGRFAALVAGAEGSAPRLVRTMMALPMWRDVAVHDGHPVHLLKRAQIVVADLAAALPGSPLAPRDLESLTAFADNLVPHVLRLDGVLEVDPSLADHIEREALLEPGAPEEVELRAAAVTAIERLSDALHGRGAPLAPWQLDQWLWTRGAGLRYKARPRHRCRCWHY